MNSVFSLLTVVAVAVAASAAAKKCRCPMSAEVLCGSDNKTYNNKCLLDCAAKKNKSLRMLHDGFCALPDGHKKFGHGFTDLDDGTACACTKRVKPVCGSNLYTFRNMCTFKCAAKKNKSLRLLYPRRCKISFIV